jgi:hypothetical protein
MRGQHTTHSVRCMRRAIAATSSELGAGCVETEPNHQAVAWCSASDWSAQDGSGLLRLGGSSTRRIQKGPVGSSG